MDQLIKFRHFADSVSQHEFECLMPEISRIIGKDVLISLLYNHFNAKRNNPNDSGYGQIEQINQQISAIVNKNILTEPKLDKISEPLINKISSYLDIKSYTKFERCNRTIFITARSPNQLYHINSDNICRYIKYCNENDQIVDQNRFCRVKSLQINGFPFESQWTEAHLIFNNLQNLYICFYNGYEPKLDAMIRSKELQLTKLKKLTLTHFTSSSNKIINDILSKAENLKFLDLAYLDEAPTLDPISQGTIKNLSDLSLRFYSDYDPDHDVQSLVSAENDILNQCGSELESFHTGLELTEFNLNHKQFPNLIELCLDNNHDSNVIDSITKFKHLQRLQLELSDGSDDIRTELNTKFVNGLFSLDELEYIDFTYVSIERIGKLLKLIQNALMIHRKNELKICIYCDGKNDESICNDMYIDLEVFVNSLDFLISQDFMFIFYGDDIPKSEDEKIEKWLNSLDDKRFWWFYKSLWCGYFVVANKEYNIDTSMF